MANLYYIGAIPLQLNRPGGLTFLVGPGSNITDFEIPEAQLAELKSAGAVTESEGEFAAWKAIHRPANRN